MAIFSNRLEILLMNSDLRYKYQINDNEYFNQNKIVEMPKIAINSNTKEVVYKWLKYLAPKLVIKISNTQADKSNKDKLRDIIEYRFDLIRLYKLCRIDFSKTLIYKDDNYLFEMPKPNYYVIYNVHDFTDNLFTFKAREIIKFKEFWSFWPPTLEKLNNTIKSAITNHKMAFFAPLLSDKLTYLITAYETLYLKGVERQEFTYKLATRVSEVVGRYLSKSDSKAKVYEFIKLCYNLRSKIVHGEIISNKNELNKYARKDKYFNSNSIYELWVYIEKFLRVSIQFFNRNEKLFTKEFKDQYTNPFLFQEEITKFYSMHKIILGD